MDFRKFSQKYQEKKSFITSIISIIVSFLFFKRCYHKKGNNEIRLLPIKGKISVDLPFLSNNVVYFSIDIDDPKTAYFIRTMAKNETNFKTQNKNLRFLSYQKEIYLAEIHPPKKETILYDFKVGKLIPIKSVPFFTRSISSFYIDRKCVL